MATIQIMKKVNSCVLVANKVKVSTYLNQTVGQSLLFNTHFSSKLHKKLMFARTGPKGDSIATPSTGYQTQNDVSW